MLLLIRHGATNNNTAVPIRLQGRRSDLPLSAEGQTQAASVAEFLTPQPLAAVYASPLVRAQQTAAAIAGRHGLSVQTLDELIEVDVGEWEGMSWEAIAARDPDAHRLFISDPARNPYLGGENMQQVLDRVGSVLDGLVIRHHQETVAVVAHNVVNRAYLAPLLGLPLSKARGIHQDNCGINVIERHEGRTKLVTLNSVWHLRKG